MRKINKYLAVMITVLMFFSASTPSASALCTSVMNKSICENGVSTNCKNKNFDLISICLNSKNTSKKALCSNFIYTKELLNKRLISLKLCNKTNTGDCVQSGANCAQSDSDCIKEDTEKTTYDNREDSEPEKNTDTGDKTNNNPEEGNIDKVDYVINEYEREVVRLVNEIRASYGLNNLEINEKLSNVARIKSQDMKDNGYFSHTSPIYGSPFDMMKNFGISYRAAGENIAMGYSTPKAVVDAWMNSKGHRENILKPSFTQIGVGYVSSGNYWTQMFIG